MFSGVLAIIYLAFIGLGLPDSVLGSAWPTMYPQLQVPVSFAGIISMIISAGTVISSLQSDRLTRRFGPGLVTAVSVGMTAVALLGFSRSTAYWMLVVFAIPYGLGAGSVDASLNNYVALHYASRHMSWLHCMWGVGAAAGPMIMGAALTRASWPAGYLAIAAIQFVLTAALFLSLPGWKHRPDEQNEASGKPLGLGQVLRLPGAGETMITFFCYCALEHTTGLWAASYLVLSHGVDGVVAARYASLFYIGITVGRAINGFLAMRIPDRPLVRMGQCISLAGVVLLLLPVPEPVLLAALIVVGLGCAPVYPCLIHATPALFGADKSQAVIGVQMACAYVGTTLMPPIFGTLADWIDIGLFPWFLAAVLLLETWMHERLIRMERRRK